MLVTEYNLGAAATDVDEEGALVVDVYAASDAKKDETCLFFS